MPPPRQKSSPGLPPYAPSRSDDRFPAVVPPPEIAPAIFWPEDFDHPAAKVQIRALKDVVVDHENRLRAKEGEDFAAAVELAAEDAIERRENAATLTWATRFLKLAKWLLVLAIGAAIPQIVKWWIDPKPQNPPQRYDKDGTPLPPP